LQEVCVTKYRFLCEKDGKEIKVTVKAQSLIEAKMKLFSSDFVIKKFLFVE
jgi:hypothetical protein